MKSVWISPRFHLWNPPKIIKASVSAKTLSVWWMQGGGLWPRISWNPPDFTMRNGGFHPWNLAISPRFHLWNPPKIIKAIVSAKTLQFDECRVGAMDQGISPMKSGGFHPDFTCEIHPNYKSKCFSKNSSVWWMQGGGYDQKDFMKSARFHMDFMKSSRFHVKSTQNLINSDVSAKTLQFGWISPEICRISWNPYEIHMKSARFHEIRMKSGGFHTDFMKSAGFHEIRRISCEIERPLARNCNPMFYFSFLNV